MDRGKLETQGMIYINCGKFMSVIDGQREARDTGDDIHIGDTM